MTTESRNFHDADRRIPTVDKKTKIDTKNFEKGKKCENSQ